MKKIGPFPIEYIVGAVFVGLLLLWLVRSTFLTRPWWSGSVINHKVSKSDLSLRELWSKSNVFAGSTSGKLTAAQGLLFINGSLEQTQPDTVLALDGEKGTLRWKYEDKNLDAVLSATSSTLYIGFGGTGQLGAYELQTGQPYWVKRLPNSRSVIRLFVVDHLVHVESTNHIFHLVQVDTGEILQTYTAPTVATVQAAQVQLQVISPTLQIEPEFFQDSTFITNEMIFEQRNDTIRAVNRQTKEFLWERTEKTVSNIVTTNSTLYMLTLDGKLVGIDIYNGQLVTSVQFEPSPFIRYNPEGQIRNYYIAVDMDKKLLYALLGDSRQLFAFQVAELSND